MITRIFIGCVTAAAVTGCSFDGVGSGPGTLDDARPAAETRVFQLGPDYQGTVDTELDEDNPDTDRSDLSEMRFDISTGNSQGKVMSLLRFDAIFGEGDGQVPADAEIVAATLSVTVVRGGDPGLLCDMVSAWSGQSNWNDFGAGAGPQSGDNFDPQAVGPVSGADGVHEIDVLPSVQSWHQGLLANDGWLFFPEGNNGVRLATSEAPPSDRPMLEIKFNPN